MKIGGASPNCCNVPVRWQTTTISCEALSIVDEALSIDAGNVTAIALRARVVAERSAHDAERVTETARQQRHAHAAPSLRNAQRAFQDGDFERARWSAENALALDPDSQEAMALLAQIAAAMPDAGIR